MIGGEMICVDGSFSAKALEVYRQYNVITPEQDKIYTPREIVHHSIGKKGVRLEEIVNPTMPVNTGIISINIEPSWAFTRFRNLDSTEISAEQIQNMVKEQDDKIEKTKYSLDDRIKKNYKKR